MEELERRLETMDVQLIYLLTRRGVPAVEFYESCGFLTSERTIVMVKET